MKKLLNKFKKPKDDKPSTSRITSETVAQHRELILAGGRRFKYPIQYARHKLVINAILISVAALLAIVATGWWQLYSVQNTSDFMYRITRVIPLPVANVDGQPVMYSDYLMKYLSSVHYLESKEQVNLKTDDGKRQINYIKQQSMQDAIADAYALKMSQTLGVNVSDIDVEAFLLSERQSSDGEISEQTYYSVILDYYGWDRDEYLHVTRSKLLRQKVAYAMDDKALDTASKIKASLDSSPSANFKDLTTKFSEQSGLKISSGASGLVPVANRDGGLAAAAAKMSKGSISTVIKSTTGDGYYILRVLSVNDSKVSYEYINVPLTVFNESLKEVIDDNKVNKYITIEEDNTNESKE
jgi:hypothetical protein